MTRIGKKPIPIPKGVEVSVNESVVSVKGPKGKLEHSLTHGVDAKVNNSQVELTLKIGFEENRAFLGLHRALISNMIDGSTTGFSQILNMVGVGYRAAVQGKGLNLQVGTSHPVSLLIPEGIKVEVEKNTRIVITGMDKQQIGVFASKISSMRPPEPYQGKGICKEGQYVRRKAGKTAAKKSG